MIDDESAVFGLLNVQFDVVTVQNGVFERLQRVFADLCGMQTSVRDIFAV